MKIRLLAGLMGVGLMLAAQTAPKDQPAPKEKKQPTMDADMRRAIAFEHFKDAAAARQARLEAKHSSVSYDNMNANRSADRSADETEGRPVKDPGPPPKKDK